MLNRRFEKAIYNLPKRNYYRQDHQRRLQQFRKAQNEIMQDYFDSLQDRFHKIVKVMDLENENYFALRCEKCGDEWLLKFDFARYTADGNVHARYAPYGASFLQKCKGKRRRK